jgi:hypothetical protein
VVEVLKVRRWQVGYPEIGRGLWLSLQTHTGCQHYCQHAGRYPLSNPALKQKCLSGKIYAWCPWMPSLDTDSLVMSRRRNGCWVLSVYSSVKPPATEPQCLPCSEIKLHRTRKLWRNIPTLGWAPLSTME